MKKLPLIDLSMMETGHRPELVKDIRRAAEEIGFFLVSDTGIDTGLVKSMFFHAKKFFNRPHCEKNQYRSVEDNQGWIPTGQEILDPGMPGDIKESFTMCDIDRTSQLLTYWPEISFRDSSLSFYRGAYALSMSLLMLLAEGLQLPANWFLAAHDSADNPSALRLLHYPRVDGCVPSGSLGAGAHTDYGSITLLWQDYAGGLEIMDRQGEWLEVKPQGQNIVVVNIGDLMQRWTNDVLRSTPHRVQPRLNSRDRYSIAFFCNPDKSAEISVAPTCIEPARCARYQAIYAGEYIGHKLASTTVERV